MAGNTQPSSTLLDYYGLADAPALWLVDLNNEPNLSDPRRIAELREEAAHVHQVAPVVSVTIGGWKSKVPGHPGASDWQDPADVPRFINLVDVVSAHLHDQGIIGAVAWIIAPRPARLKSESYEGDMTGWALVLDQGQHPLPAAQVLSVATHRQVS